MKTLAALSVLLYAISGWAEYPNGPNNEGSVTAASLLNWVAQHKTAANLKVSNGFANREGEAMNVSLYQVGNKTSGATFFESNMDVDCDGSRNGVCGGLDPSHQNTLSCGCSVNEGGSVDANLTPFVVLPIGSPFNSSSRGIELGQIAACIYKAGSSTGIVYAVFLDEDGLSTEIGEGSAALNKFLGINPDPDQGGSEGGNTYIVFPGSSYQLTTNADRANHALAISKGVAAATALLSAYPTETIQSGSTAQHSAAGASYQINLRTINVKAAGSHTVSFYALNGEKIMERSGKGFQNYNLSQMKSGSYILKVSTSNGLSTNKIILF
jgi:hypothetical protein